MIQRPYLLYSYPWMPYPRRVLIFLRERNIPQHLVRPVAVSDPGPNGDRAEEGFPPRPPGSLPVLAVPRADDDGYDHIGDSVAIMRYLDGCCQRGEHGFPEMKKKEMTPMEEARQVAFESLANELTSSWNGVRLMGTAAGPPGLSFPKGSKELLRWIHRFLTAIEGQHLSHEMIDDMIQRTATVAEILLYQFLDFTHDCYGVDLTIGSGEIIKEVYGRDTKDEFPLLRRFWKEFRERKSAIREGREMVPDQFHRNMTNWAEGILESRNIVRK
ncbi:hypothetical protein PROFUN_03190 [Planoprotostelium fungivorum]|uniref:GST N-terminal domain-containing protein n=1 Tax=Planoprotostelium fungivorum TaxID=1890364 RepID=A0A2P6NWY7_9EUKA|nr:hypothetical protein PROFUN_03190 [Planoprotostelium fungivorum]